MMASVSVNIELLSEQGTYSPGDVLKGLINLSVAQQVIISRITVKVVGMCIVNQVAKDPDRKILSQRRETYFRDEKCLYDCNEKDTVNLYTEAGDHILPFSFELPENIPSSFESEEGYIRYFISSSLERVNFPLISKQMIFSVNAPLDLNAIPKSQYPSTAVVDKRSNTWCCAKTKLHVGVHIPRRGFVPGEVIVLNAEIHNLDSKPVVSAKAQLMQIIKYHHKSWPRKTKRLVSEVTRGYILPNESQYWHEETIIIPSVVSSYLKHCSFIDVKYKIYFRISKAGMPEIIMKQPIIIGNVPLMGCIDVIDHLEADQHSISSLERAKKNYEPCFFGPHDVTESTNEKSEERCMFSPRYTIYSS